jgi:site-specific DNA recombinase
MEKAQNMMLDQKIDLEDYKSIKSSTQNKIAELEQEKAKLDFFESNYSKYLEWNYGIIQNLDQHYLKSPLETKQNIISSIFPEKLYFEDGQYRTNRINEVVGLLLSSGVGSMALKKEKPGKFAELSVQVEPEGIEPSSKQETTMLSSR